MFVINKNVDMMRHECSFTMKLKTHDEGGGGGGGATGPGLTLLD